MVRKVINLRYDFPSSISQRFRRSGNDLRQVLSQEAVMILIPCIQSGDRPLSG